jgi:S1-C subfamily serine protease
MRPERGFHHRILPIFLGLLLVGCGAAGSPQSDIVPRASSPAPPATATLAPSPTAGSASPAAATAALPSPSTGATSLAQRDPVLGDTSGPGIIAEVAAKVRPAVVQVTSEVLTFNQLSPATLVPSGVGSGVIFDRQGHILTNNHVVAGAQRLDVSLPDGRSFTARLIGRDPRSDLAVLQIQGDNLPIAPLGDSSKLVVGQWVVAIGNALALPGGPTVTAGVVSALGRTVQEPGPGPFLFDVIQTDAPINPGNSGGPLINLQGEVIGINTLAIVQAEPGVPAQSLGFAIAINTAKPIADEIIRTGRVTYAYLGVGLYPNSPAVALRFGLPNRPGMIITQIDPNGPAAAAGLQVGDVITAADGKALTDESVIYRVLQAHRPGDHMTLTVARGSTERTVTVTLGVAPSG